MQHARHTLEQDKLRCRKILFIVAHIVASVGWVVKKRIISVSKMYNFFCLASNRYTETHAARHIKVHMDYINYRNGN